MFDPKQVFSSPSINYCGYGEVYCKPRVFNGERFIVAFQIRLHPDSYTIGQQTVTRAKTPIDQLFDNNELEYYFTARGGHKLQRLLVRRLAGPGVSTALLRAAPGTNHHPRLGHGVQDYKESLLPKRPAQPAERNSCCRRPLMLALGLLVAVVCAAGAFVGVHAYGRHAAKPLRWRCSTDSVHPTCTQAAGGMFRTQAACVGDTRCQPKYACDSSTWSCKAASFATGNFSSLSACAMSQLWDCPEWLGGALGCMKPPPDNAQIFQMMLEHSEMPLSLVVVLVLALFCQVCFRPLPMRHPLPHKPGPRRLAVRSAAVRSDSRGRGAARGHAYSVAVHPLLPSTDGRFRRGADRRPAR